MTDQRRRAYEWAHANFPAVSPPEPFHPALILEKEGDIQAVVVYTSYDPVNSNVELHVAAVPGRRWMTRAFLAKAFGYPFDELGCRRITCRIASTNTDAIRFTLHCGWTLEGIIRKAWNGDDIFIFGMLREECRFLGSMCHGETFAAFSSRSGRNGSGSDAIERPNGIGGRGTGTDQPADALRVEHL